MMYYSFIITIISVILFSLLVFSVRLNLRLRDKLEEIIYQIDESLDILDACYKRVAQKAKMEVFSDDPTVRSFINDIKRTRDVILVVANLLVEPVKDDSDDDDTLSNDDE